jgi:hypothetical protein
MSGRPALPPLTPAEVAAAWELCSAATPGPWEAIQEVELEGGKLSKTSEWQVAAYPPDGSVRGIASARHTEQQADFGRDDAPLNEGPVGLREHDAAFIAAARTLLPRALAAIEDLARGLDVAEANVERLQAVLKKIADRWPRVQAEDRCASQDLYDGGAMCEEARRAPGRGEGT